MRNTRRYGLALLTSLICLLAATVASGAVGIDATVFKDQNTPSTTVTTPAFSISSGNQLLLAFVSADNVSAPNTTVTAMSGGGLTWVLVRRTNVQLGSAEIWRAFSVAPLSAISVRATLSQAVDSSITVMSFTGVDTTGTNGSGAVGATSSGNAASGAPTATLVTTRAGSWILGVGADWDNPIARSLGPGQTLVHQYFPPVGDTYWVQRQTNPTPTSGTSVTINDTAPAGDRYNLTIVEVLPPAAGGGPTFTISGAISPAASGSGSTVTLAQNGTTITTTTANASGNYSFTGLANGTYTVTPSKTGFTFNPASQTAVVNGGDVTVPTFAATAVSYSISGAISPAASGNGSTVTLAQNGTTITTTTANASGNYSFTGLANGTYTVTPSKTGFTFNPTSQTAVVSGSNVTVPTFAATGAPPTPLFPDFKSIIPTDKISIVQGGSGRELQYTHDILNAGPGPLIIQPAYNPAAGTYNGTQYIYSQSSSGAWSVSQTIPLAGEFFFHAEHGHFHFPLASFGLYTVAADGGPGTSVALSPKVGFCIGDSYIYDPTLPNAGALGSLLGPCQDPTSLRGLSIGAVDEYDRTDPGQNIPIGGLPDGEYWLRTLVDPNNFLAERDKTNNETDVLVRITGSTVQALNTVRPVLNAPPQITLTSPSDSTTVTGLVQIAASTSTTSGVVFLLDGQDFPGNIASAPPYTISWDSTSVPNGDHWLAAQTSDSTGIIGTSTVVRVTVANATGTRPVVKLESPETGSILSSTVTLYATVASSQPISNVTFYVDSVQVGPPVTTPPPYLLSWDSTTVTDGSHVFSASATDTFGTIGNSAPVTATVDNSHPPKLIGKEVTVWVDGNDTMSTPVFSTSIPGDLLVAFVSYDGPLNASQTASISGAGLTWELLVRSNTQAGTAEIWAARASGILSGASITSRPGFAGFHGSMSVIAFSNAAGTSVVGRAGAPTGPPNIYLPGVIAGDWVFAVGNDWDRATARVPASGQVLVHQRVDTQVGDTFWVQSTTAPASVNGLVEIRDTSPTNDQWNYASVEIVAARN